MSPPDYSLCELAVAVNVMDGLWSALGCEGDACGRCPLASTSSVWARARTARWVLLAVAVPQRTGRSMAVRQLLSARLCLTRVLPRSLTRWLPISHRCRRTFPSLRASRRSVPASSV